MWLIFGLTSPNTLFVKTKTITLFKLIQVTVDGHNLNPLHLLHDSDFTNKSFYLEPSFES